MLLLLTRRQRKDSASSGESSISNSSTSGRFRNYENKVSVIRGTWQIWYRKSKETSLSPSPPRQQASSASDSTFTDSSRASTKSRDQGIKGSRPPQQSQHATTAGAPSPAPDSATLNQLQSIPQANAPLPPDQSPGPDQPEQSFGFISNHMPAWAGRRRSSMRMPEIQPPQDFTAKELARPLVLSRPSCPIRVGRVSRAHPEPGWRVATRPRSPESCFTTTRPMYSAWRHSPHVTGRPFTIYYEGEIRPGNSEDGVCLSLGFVAVRDRASLMPGFERGSVGVHCRDGGLYVNNILLKNAATAAFEPGQQVGIGITFSMSDCNAQQVDDAQSSTVSSSSIKVEVFLSRDGKKAGSWNLRELRQLGGLPLEGLEGTHDLYAAVGTSREVNVDILFEKRDWRYDAEAG